MQKLRPGDPERIGPYELVARLGSGGMGVVFLGTNGVDRFAIKVVRNSFIDDPGLQTRFVREIETLKKVSSPYVARIFDSSVEGELAWHAVEFVNGPSLQELVLSKGPLSEADWLTFANQLRLALDSIHSLGIVHRDIKPSNIVMSETGPKLIDFGLSQDSDATSVTMTGMVAGSPAWLSPEQLDGGEITPASDLFSAGSVLVFAASGNSPWGASDSTSVPVVFQRILSGSNDLSALSPRQRAVVEGLLNPEPKARSFLAENTKSVSEQPRVNFQSERIVRARTETTRPTPGKRFGIGLLLAGLSALVTFAALDSLNRPNSSSSGAVNSGEAAISSPAGSVTTSQDGGDGDYLALDSGTSFLLEVRTGDSERWDGDDRLPWVEAKVSIRSENREEAPNVFVSFSDRNGRKIITEPEWADDWFTDCLAGFPKMELTPQSSTSRWGYVAKCSIYETLDSQSNVELEFRYPDVIITEVYPLETFLK